MKIAALSITLLFSTLVFCFAQTENFNPLGPEVDLDDLEKQLRIQVEWIEMAHQDYTALMAEKDPVRPIPLKSGNDGKLREKLAKMVEEEKATILDTAMVIARSGQRAKVESIHEVIYATEFIPRKEITVKGEGAERSQTTTTAVGLPIPTSFETRNVGTTLEVDPVLGADGVTIDLNLNPEIVYHVGDVRFGEFESEGGHVEATMPLFYAIRVSTSLTMRAGEYALIGVQSPHKPESGLADFTRKVLVLVKSDLMVVGLPVEE